ncbi:MAG: sugar ABC transporter ATP-binding protein [Acidobacteriia bacterium]|nr:sugar ABC transporter ATP-binding protein [Terriglobia bacterium]
MTAAPAPPPLLRLEGISKSFGGAPVLSGVAFEVRTGEVHALVGENGAGKSTLMNIVSGVLQPDAGRMEWAGVPVAPHNPRAAQDLGISFVHQELALVPQLSIAENVFLGRHPSRRIGLPLVKWGELRERAKALLAELGHDVDPRTLVEQLSIGEQQLVEIARALACVSRLIVMDEPTAPLSERETERLFEVIGRLRSRGVSIVYITHRLKEVYSLADRVTVLRDGLRIVTAPVSEMPHDLLVRHMVGRELSEEAAGPHDSARPEVMLRVDGLARGRDFRDIGFAVRRGEIVALAGLVGAGRSEVLESLFGVSPAGGGRIHLAGREVKIRTPADAIRAGMALVPDDRKAKGLMLGASVRTNMVLASERRFVIRCRNEAAAAARMIGELRVRTRGAERPAGELSGGNQQKVVLAKWLLADARVFLLDEPTRGVDVGAKSEIYALIRALARRGAAILFASSELDEVLRLADRILVMHRGRIAGELTRAEATEEGIMRLATGGSE